ncbi:hypothetical protein D3C87_1773570 [compost metagenome]
MADSSPGACEASQRPASAPSAVSAESGVRRKCAFRSPACASMSVGKKFSHRLSWLACPSGHRFLSPMTRL